MNNMYIKTHKLMLTKFLFVIKTTAKDIDVPV